MNKDLWTIAQLHADDIGINGLTSHSGSFNTTPTKRAERIGLKASVYENLSFGNYETALECILNILIDDGVKSRIHREILFRQNIHCIGVGFAKHSIYEYCYVIDYAEIKDEPDHEEMKHKTLMKSGNN